MKPATWGRALLAIAVTVGAVVAPASAASAHGSRGGPTANDFKATIVSFEPGEGVAVRVLDGDGGIELTNETSHVVEVAGYEGEPYLRIDTAGVFENTRSPATYLNRSPSGDVVPPLDADAGAEPVWRQVTAGRTARWHDHRAHWMSPFDPPIDPASGGGEQVVYPSWTIPVSVDGRAAPIVGRLTWAPPPDPLPWLAAAAAVLIALVTAGVRRWWAWVVVGSCAALLAAAGLDAIGVAAASGAPVLDEVSDLASPLVAVVVLATSLALLGHHQRGALMGIAFGSAVLALEFGYLSLAYLERSQIPSALDPTVSRLTVAVAIAAGTAAAVVAVHRLATTPPLDEANPPTPPRRS